MMKTQLTWHVRALFTLAALTLQQQLETIVIAEPKESR